MAKVNESEYLKQLNSGKVLSEDEQLVAAEKNLKIHERSVELGKKTLELEERLFKIVREHSRLIIPEREFQTMDDYWEVEKELMDIKHEKQIHGTKLDIEQTEKVVKLKKEELERLKGE